MKTEKEGNYWKAYYDAETGRYFARIMYISREGLEEYRFAQVNIRKIFSKNQKTD